MSIIVNGIELTEVIYAGVNLDTVKVKKGTAEAVTVFEKMTQLSTPQNVTADGTVVSWDEVENATSYEVIEGGNNALGTVKASFTLDARAANAYVRLKYKKDGIVTASDYDGTLDNAPTPTKIEGIKSYITFGALENGESITRVDNMVNCTNERISAQIVKLTLTGNASADISAID